MLNICKLRSRDRARDLQEATNSTLVLESPIKLHYQLNYTCMHVILRNLLFITHCRSVGYILKTKIYKIITIFGLYEDC